MPTDPEDEHRRDLLHFLAANALENLPRLGQAADRAKLLEAVALIVPDSQAKTARHAAFLVREADEQQLKFAALFK